MSPTGALEPGYVRARAVLLDGLQALGRHIGNVVLVGAQAVYLHAGEADLAVAPFTTDGDLALDPRGLADEPLIEEALEAAGFVRGGQPGSWQGAHGVILDILVPESIGGAGTRGARIPPHSRHAARKARGLEAALTDNALHAMAALDPGDPRLVSVRVAGAAALMVSKLIKIGERVGDRRRIETKDAYDVYRLLRTIETELLAARLTMLRGDTLAGETTAEAVALLGAHFTRRDSTGTQMVVDHAGILDDPLTIAESCSRLAQRLVNAV